MSLVADDAIDAQVGAYARTIADVPRPVSRFSDGLGSLPEHDRWGDHLDG